MQNGLNTKALALSAGITWGLGIFILGLYASWTGTGVEIIEWLGKYYKGFHPTFLGSIIGGLWGFVDTFIGAWVFGGIYNFFASRLR